MRSKIKRRAPKKTRSYARSVRLRCKKRSNSAIERRSSGKKRVECNHSHSSRGKKSESMRRLRRKIMR